MLGEDAEILIVGFGITVTDIVLVLVQEPSLPVTVYIVLVAGVTKYGFADDGPGSQVYEVADDVAVNVELLPAQIILGDATTDICGGKLTKTGIL